MSIIDLPAVCVETRFRKRDGEEKFGDVFWVCRGCGLNDHEDGIVNVTLNSWEEMFLHISKHYTEADKAFRVTLETLARRMIEAEDA